MTAVQTYSFRRNCFSAFYFLIAYIIFWFSPRAIGANIVRGSMELACTPPVTLDIHLSGFRNQETATFHLFASPIKSLKRHKELHTSATWCISSGKCETADGIIIFKYLKLSSRASGTYSLVFNDGHKAEGQFDVLRNKQKSAFICE